jgi:hypothetical protein
MNTTTLASVRHMPNAMAREIAQSGTLSGASNEVLSLVNPLTGLANDYLNVYNEILLLLEFVPSMPEMTDDALAWQPRGYCEYFEQSSIPGARDALHAYDKLDPGERAHFEAILARLTEIAVHAQTTLAEEFGRPDYPDSIAKSCEETANVMRAGLAYVARLINEGRSATKSRQARKEQRILTDG